MSKAIITSLTMLLVLIGCAHQPPPMPMGNSVRHVQNMEDFMLRVHFVTGVELKRAYAHMHAISPFDGYAGKGITLVDYKSRRCDIYVQPPLLPLGRGMMTLGHELSHCIFGDFHSRRPRDWTKLNSAEVAISRQCLRLILAGKPLPPKCRKKH